MSSDTYITILVVRYSCRWKAFSLFKSPVFHCWSSVESRTYAENCQNIHGCTTCNIFGFSLGTRCFFQWVWDLSERGEGVNPGGGANYYICSPTIYLQSMKLPLIFFFTVRPAPRSAPFCLTVTGGVGVVSNSLRSFSYWTSIAVDCEGLFHLLARGCRCLGLRRLGAWDSENRWNDLDVWNTIVKVLTLQIFSCLYP